MAKYRMNNSDDFTKEIEESDVITYFERGTWQTGYLRDDSMNWIFVPHLLYVSETEYTTNVIESSRIGVVNFEMADGTILPCVADIYKQNTGTKLYAATGAPNNVAFKLQSDYAETMDGIAGLENYVTADFETYHMTIKKCPQIEAFFGANVLKPGRVIYAPKHEGYAFYADIAGKHFYAPDSWNALRVDPRDFSTKTALSVQTSAGTTSKKSTISYLNPDKSDAILTEYAKKLNGFSTDKLVDVARINQAAILDLSNPHDEFNRLHYSKKKVYAEPSLVSYFKSIASITPETTLTNEQGEIPAFMEGYKDKNIARDLTEEELQGTYKLVLKFAADNEFGEHSIIVNNIHFVEDGDATHDDPIYEY